MDSKDHTWQGAWDEHGVRVDDDMSVSIRVGVIEVDGRLSLAVSLASGVPVAITDRTAVSLIEMMQWARAEYELLDDLHQQRRTEGAKDALDRAVLTRRQWRAVMRVFDQPGHTDDADIALRTLRTAAPPAWTSEPDNDAQPRLAKAETAMTRLDSLDAQLDDIAEQIRALRATVPATDYPDDPSGEPRTQPR